MHSTGIFGCGNLIMGDDGFGPAVVEELSEIAAQIEYIPAEIEPGLSEPMKNAVSEASEMDHAHLIRNQPER